MTQKNSRSIESQLAEIREMLNVILTYTYISETTTLQDLYTDIKKQQEELLVEEIKEEMKPEDLKELLAYAYKTLNFKIEGKYMVITKDEKIIHVPLEMVNDGNSGK